MGHLMAVRCLLAAFAAALATPLVAQEDITLPSGHDVRFHEVIWGQRGPAGLTIRFRFVDEALAEREDEAGLVAVTDDAAFLCDTYALDRISSNGPQPSQIVISIAEKELPFGEPNPDVKQVFEAFTVTDGHCEWDLF